MLKLIRLLEPTIELNFLELDDAKSYDPPPGYDDPGYDDPGYGDPGHDEPGHRWPPSGYHHHSGPGDHPPAYHDLDDQQVM